MRYSIDASMGLFSHLCGCLLKPQLDDSAEEEMSDFFFNFQALQTATNFFSESNRLGHGGFGPVYMGLMSNGQEVAVKKLSLNSRQGLNEFTNEVKVLLRVQHKNLVMLLGCCAEGPEKMLVYEYLPNRSLDYFLFDKRKSALLDWTRRFQIVRGIARGLLYLHEEAPERILHRDIKASNILLDDQLNPKISDFGLARLFPEEQTHLNTFKISGTHGYMAPEYALHGYLSVKTDVFSFGILVLEIVSGRKNHDESLGAVKGDLLNYSWTLFEVGKSLEVVDSSLDKFRRDEAAMCIQLGLLCCQANVADRPDMNTVRLMLSSDSFTLPTPGKPGIHGRVVSHWTTTTSAAFTDNTTTTAATTKPSTGIDLDEDYSRNSMSYSSIDEGEYRNAFIYGSWVAEMINKEYNGNLSPCDMHNVREPIEVEGQSFGANVREQEAANTPTTSPSHPTSEVNGKNEDDMNLIRELLIINLTLFGLHMFYTIENIPKEGYTCFTL